MVGKCQGTGDKHFCFVLNPETETGELSQPGVA